MTELCIKIYRYFRNHRAVFWVSMIALYAIFGYYASNIYLEEDINKLMPVSKNEDGSTKLAFANLRIKDMTFLLFEGKDGASVEHIAETCDSFMDSLMVKNAARDSSKRMLGNVFYKLSDDLIFDLIDYLSAHLPSYIDTSVYADLDTMLTYPHMKRQMQANREDLLGPIGSMFPELIQMDPLGLRSVLQDQLKPLMGGGSGGYKMINSHFFVRDSTVCVAFITPAYSALNTGQGSALFRTLNDQINQFALSAPDISICYHGTPASGFYNASQIKTDLKGGVIGSLVLVLIVICICFRNYNTVPLLLLPVLFGSLFGLAAMYWIKGQLSLMALGIGAIVMGVALSYVLHVITQYKYVSDPEQVLQDEVKPVCLGCLTTIGSFMGLIFIQTELLQDFGMFAALAIVGTTFFSLVFLPQFFNPAKNKVNRRLFSLIDRLNGYPFDRKKPLLAVILVVALVCVGFYFVGGTQFDADIHNLGYKAEETTYSEELLRSKTFTGDKQKNFASSGATMEEAIGNFSALIDKLDSLKEVGLVKGYSQTNLIFIPLQTQQMRIDAWKNYWSEDRLRLVHELIYKTAPEAGLRPEAFNAFFDCATGDYEPDALYDAGIIPEGYRATLMEQSYNGEYLCFTSVRCSNDTIRGKDSDYNRICDAVASLPNQLVLDTYYYTTDTLMQLNEEFNVLQWVSMLFVLIVLFISFRANIRYTLLGFMPILLSWLIVLGAMVIFNVQFNLVNIIISTFIFGIGVDYSIFVMNGLIGSEKDSRLLGYHKTAIFFSAFILIVTVSSMLFAEHPAIQSVGFSTLVGLISAVVLSYVVQPAFFKMIPKKKEK